MPNATKLTATVALAGLALSLAACESANPNADRRMLPSNVALSRQAPRPYDASRNPVTKPLAISDAMYASPADGPRLIERISMGGQTRELAGGAPEFETNGPASRLVRVRYEAEGAQLSEVLGVLITDFLERDYVMRGDIAGMVNLSIDEELTTEELERFVAGLCSLYDISLSEQDGRYVIRTRTASTAAGGGKVPATAPIYFAEPLLGNELPAVRLRKLRYANPESVSNVVKELMSSGSLVSTSGDLLVLVDTASQIKRMSNVISALDVPAFENTELMLFELQYTTATDAQQALTNLATASGLAGSNTLVSFTALPNGRELLVVSKDPSVSRQAENLLRLVDRPIDAPGRARFTYTAQNTSADSLIRAFSDFFPDRVESEDNPAGVRFVPFAPSTPSGGLSSLAQGASGTTGAAPRSLGGSNNARKILIHATPRDYQDMVTLFRELDRPPQQVNMRVVVAEVGLTDDLSFGVEYFLNATDSNGSGEGFGDLDLLGTPGGIANPTGSIIFTATDGFAVLEALDSVADTRLLSSPTISAVHGGIASIQVGGEEPIPAGDTISSGGNVTDNIERRDTGVTVEAQPFINESGEIRMQLMVDIADLGPNRGDLGPSFTTRILNTEIQTRHGQTYLIGGIIIDNSSKTKSSIPGLGNLPIVGAAFGTQSDMKDRTELLIAITTTIADTPGDADVFMSDFMRSTHALRDALSSREEDLAQGFLFDRIKGGTGLEPIADGTLIEPAPRPETVEPAPDTPAEDEAVEEQAPELEIPPIIRRMLESAGSNPSQSPREPESDG
ncbi:MAG: hypothetical protein RLN60_01010 [Phycisphaerales bacterium]